MQVSELSGNGSLDASNLQEQIDWLVKYSLVKTARRSQQADRHDLHRSRGARDRQGLSLDKIGIDRV